MQLTAPRVLLLSTLAPGSGNVCCLFLRELCLIYPRNKISCFHVRPFYGDKGPELGFLPIRFGQAPAEQGYAGLGKKFRKFSRPLFERYVEVARIPEVVDDAIRYGRAQQADLVWATLDSPTLLRIAKPVAEALNVPLISMVWDPPGPLVREYQCDPSTLNRLMNAFQGAVKASLACGVASEGMKSRYEQEYGTRCVPMTYVPHGSRANGNGAMSHPNGVIEIGFAGSLWATKEWNALLAALAARQWRVAGREVVVKVFGSRLNQSTSHPLRLEYLGWRDEREVIELLSRMTVGYVPFWFDDAFAEHVQLSFPTKLATYVAAGLPVFYHGPYESSPRAFLNRFPVGVGCHSLDPDEIIRSLEQLVTDPHLLPRARLACDEAFNQELSPEVFRSRFAELLNIRREDLAPESGCQ